MLERKSLEIIKYNKNLQKRINIKINNYKAYSEKYSSIEIEIIPKKDEYCQFIYIEDEDEEYYHIYFNDNKGEEIKITSLNENDQLSKINIIIDYQAKSFSYLFNSCKCNESTVYPKIKRSLKKIFFCTCPIYLFIPEFINPYK